LSQTIVFYSIASCVALLYFGECCGALLKSPSNDGVALLGKTTQTGLLIFNKLVLSCIEAEIEA